MARQGSSEYLKTKDCMTFGLYKAFREKIKNILLHMLRWGTPNRKTGELFYDYLLTTKAMSKTRLKKIFNRGQRVKLKNDHQMESFDMTLLFLCIMHGCDGLAPPNDSRWEESMDTLEGQITCLRNHRNSFVHGDYEIDEKIFHQKLQEIENLITLILEEAAKRFNKMSELQPLLETFKKELKKIGQMPFCYSPSSILCTLLRIDGRKELQNKYKCNSTISPASNLIGKDIYVEIGTVFTQLEIYESETSKQFLAVDKIFEHLESYSSTIKKILLLVDGVAGSGKTTLTRKILHEWSKGSSKMKNLDNYDLAIWTECRDGETQSLAQLLRSLMPHVTQNIEEDKVLVKSIEQNELLFIVDGLDELNESSRQVFIDILALKNTDIITIICTTRPNKVPDIRQYVPNTFTILHVKIKGIAESNRESFVKNYYRALKNQAGSINMPGLLSYLKESLLQEHLRLPFNLVLLTLLWMWKPDVVNKMTTATELFLNTFEYCKERLIQRLQDNPATREQKPDKIRENLTPFLRGITKTAFASHFNDQTVLTYSSINSLKEACRLKSLPPEGVMSSFLVQAVSLFNKNREKFSFPHKGLQDFYCALYLEGVSENEDTPVNISGIFSSIDPILDDKLHPAKKLRLEIEWKKGLDKILGEASYTYPTVRSVFENALNGVSNADQVVQLDFTKWRNILFHLIGLLHHRGRSMTDERGEEMVKLLEESGITDSDEWFDFLSNVKCDAAISKHIVLKGNIEVTDARVEAFLKVLNQAVPESVDVEINGDPSTAPGLKDLLVALREKDWRVKLDLHHDFQFPKEGGSILDGTLLELFRSNLRLEKFKGQLSASALKELPSSVDDLSLSVKDGAHFRSLIPALTSWAEKNRPAYVALHVPVDIDESSLRLLPRVRDLRLFVSDVGEATVEKASVVARALQPSGGRYELLLFPGVGRTTTDCERLVHQLSQRGVEVNNGVVVSPEMDVGERRRMRDLTRRMLNCGFFTASDDDIWKLIGLPY